MTLSATTVSCFTDLWNQSVSSVLSFSPKNMAPAISSGYNILDMASPLRAGRLLLLAGSSKMGTSCLAMSIAQNVALGLTKDGIVRRVGILSLDRTCDEYARVMLCAQAGVSINSVEDGYVSGDNQERLKVAAKTITNAPVFVDDTTLLHITDLVAKAKAMEAEHNIDLLIIDKFPLIEGGSVTATDNNGLPYCQHQIAKLLYGLAKELNITVIILADARSSVTDTDEVHAAPRTVWINRASSIQYPDFYRYADSAWLLERPCWLSHHPDRDNRSLALVHILHGEGADKTIKLKFDDLAGMFSDYETGP